ncbi:hypothetical protein M430DRAFT_245404 [Amorphotheca resinae ATCC 22711]|jgi:hypothetical protein|uniref:Uncharacterized protein n=1 Tax=Amorphotheca resinae ATCC 22711 TaxID=857342 RepID=A0A2T3AZE5_AMORE|nr:hypothetical protein M430DRAFT_245404 [Amorphotheca resinae ATCC 22711]PSS16529.1 hypothetical protein M430DRAFT_245404 [Amorphotheca resinae ATCC 22711]
MATEDASYQEPYPLYNTTFTLHRLAPLYIGHSGPLTNASLLAHARRFRDLLAGDVLRGVRVGLGSDEDVLARVGALQTVTWRVLVDEEFWDGDVGDETQMEVVGQGRGIHVVVSYEKARYAAFLLRGREERDIEEGFQRFPLLLTRMPGALRDTFTGFLASTFDTRVSALALGRGYLTSALESYITNCLVGEDGEAVELAESSQALRKILKDVQVVIGFDLPSVNQSLKTIDILIAREDLPRLVQSGKRIARNGGEENPQPFTDALTSYVHTHLALDMRHESVKILKIACGSFVLGAEGKAKLTEPSISDGGDVQRRATGMLVEKLIELAKGGKMSTGIDG